jgi:hypothetical protein
MTPFADDPPGFKRYYLNEELIEEKELTQEEIKAIEKKVGALKKEAEKKEFCYRAMKIVVTREGEPYSSGGSGEVEEDGLRIVLESYWKLPAGLFNSEEITYEVLIYYDGKLVFNGKREYEDHPKYKLRVDEIISYLPEEEWEKKLFDLYHGLPGHEREQKKKKEQSRVKKLKACFGL